MNAVRRKVTFALFAGLAAVALTSSPAAADTNRLFLSPGGDPHLIPHPNLPKFGFSSFNISGFGEKVTSVRFGGLAHRFGLERGDVILSMNGHRLSYHGSWNDALHDAFVNHSGFVRLRIRDVRSGFVATRSMHVGGVGPVTPHFHHGDVHVHAGPTTKKMLVGPGNGGPSFKLNKKIVKIGD